MVYLLPYCMYVGIDFVSIVILYGVSRYFTCRWLSEEVRAVVHTGGICRDFEYM